MFPRWLNWLLLGFMGYLLFLGSQSSPQHAAPHPTTAIPAITEKTYPALAKATDLERWKRSLNPEYAANFHCDTPKPVEGKLGLMVSDTTAGVDSPARCSDTIIVQLTVWNAKASVAYSDQLELTLGTQTIAAGLDAGLVGLAIGGQRTLMIPPALLTRHANKNAPTPPPALLAALPRTTMAVVSVVRLQ